MVTCVDQNTCDLNCFPFQWCLNKKWIASFSSASSGAKLFPGLGEKAAHLSSFSHESYPMKRDVQPHLTCNRVVFSLLHFWVVDFQYKKKNQMFEISILRMRTKIIGMVSASGVQKSLWGGVWNLLVEVFSCQMKEATPRLLVLWLGCAISSFSFPQMRKEVSGVKSFAQSCVKWWGWVPTYSACSCSSVLQILEDWRLAIWDEGFVLLWILELDETHLIH